MAGFLTDYMALKVLDCILGAQTLTPPANTYVGLFTTAPTRAGTGGVEVTGGNYARKLGANNLTTWPLATLIGTIPTKKTGILFDWGLVTWSGNVIWGGVWDSLTTGNLLYAGPFGTTRNVLSGDTFSIAINGGSFTMT